MCLYVDVIISLDVSFESASLGKHIQIGIYYVYLLAQNNLLMPIYQSLEDIYKYLGWVLFYA